MEPQIIEPAKSKPKRQKRGWPKGKSRKPRISSHEASQQLQQIMLSLNIVIEQVKRQDALLATIRKTIGIT